MANLTLNIDDDVLRRARIRALERGTSVNALVRDYLQDLVRAESEQALSDLLELSRKATSGSGPGGARTWTRDDANARD